MEEWKVQAETFKSQGNEAFKNGKWKESVTEYTKAIELDPDDKIYYSNRSAAYLKLGNSKSKALKDAEKCVELEKQWAKGHSRLGAALHSLGRLEHALDAFREAIRLDPDNDGNKKAVKGVQEAIETEKKLRWERAKRVREAEVAREEIEMKAAKEAAEDDDPLAGFLNEVKEQVNAPVGFQRKEKDIHEKYTNQNLGTPEEQIERLVAPNYKWCNLNPYTVLQLDIDATEEDIKGRYRKLSTMVHPDKRIGNDSAREAFEEVKKAYQAVMDKEKRKLVTDNVNSVRKRVAKQRAKLAAKGMTAGQLLAKFGTENAHIEQETMKEFAEMEMRRRDVDAHKQVQKNRERQDQDKEAAVVKRVYEREKKWNEEGGREGRVGSWRTFTGGNSSNLYYRRCRKTSKSKKTKMWKEEERQDVTGEHAPGMKDRKKKDDYKKSWK